MRFSAEPAAPEHPPKAGVLLANVGSPATPTPAAVRAFLAQFLADPRVVELQGLRWWLLRNLVVLPLRPRRSARLYARIWTPAGPPLLVIALRQAAALAHELTLRFGEALPVVAGMGYGEPSIVVGLDDLRRQGCRRILILPLFPQYSATTTASVFDAVTRELRSWRQVPELRTVNDYHDHPAYIRAVTNSIEETWSQSGRPERLLLSFHGLPTRYIEAGDPYLDQCRATAALLTDAIDIEPERIVTGFQSRFGREQWIEPATATLLEEWGRQGFDGLDVVCPGFAADCLETLEEIAITGRGIFSDAGGGRFRYLPALNDRPDHIAALADVAVEHLGGWIA
ncbi:MAG: ferrochelatase [Thermoanaerobaculales bacterium]